MKKFTDDYEFNFDDSGGVIILPFQGSYANIAIKKIRVGKSCSIDAVRNMLAEGGYNISDLWDIDQ